jgi:hypothetical protein
MADYCDNCDMELHEVEPDSIWLMKMWKFVSSYDGKGKEPSGGLVNFCSKKCMIDWIIDMFPEFQLTKNINQ